MKILLTDLNESLLDCWRQDFHGLDQVEIVSADICTLDVDAIVSPANSFGFMDGGLDLAISYRFGWDLEKRAQEAIRARPMQELLVGETLMVPTHDTKIPWLISAPTMRVPENIAGTVNAYLCMKAILISAITHTDQPAIKSVAIPGLGTGVGKLSYPVASFQMAQAYREVVLGERVYPEDLVTACKVHFGLLNGVKLKHS